MSTDSPRPNYYDDQFADRINNLGNGATPPPPRKPSGGGGKGGAGAGFFVIFIIAAIVRAFSSTGSTPRPNFTPPVPRFQEPPPWLAQPGVPAQDEKIRELMRRMQEDAQRRAA